VPGLDASEWRRYTGGAVRHNESHTAAIVSWWIEGGSFDHDCLDGTYRTPHGPPSIRLHPHKRTTSASQNYDFVHHDEDHMVAICHPTTEIAAFRRAIAALSVQDLITIGQAQSVSDRNCTDDRRIRLVEDLLNATHIIRHVTRPSHGWRLWRAIAEREADHAYYTAHIRATREVYSLRARFDAGANQEQAGLIALGLEALDHALLAIDQRAYLSPADYSFLIGPWAQVAASRQS
jgi:hypothetical protein